MKLNRLLFSLVLGLLLVFSSVGVSHAQIASALIREGDTLPGDSSGFLISDINPYNAQNGVGGFAFNVETFDAAGTGSIYHFWGNTTGGAGTVLRTQSTFGNFEQNSFRSFGMSDSGVLAYRGESTNTLTGTTSLRGVWLDSSSVLEDGDPIPTLPGNFSTTNTGVGITRDGTPYWRGAYSPVQGDLIGNSKGAIFLGAEQTVLLKSGDNVSGIPETLFDSSQAISPQLRFSANGTNYFDSVVVENNDGDLDSVMVSNGAAMLAGGSVIRARSSVPTLIGGLAGEVYDSFFRDKSITESGSYLIALSTYSTITDAYAELMMIDGEIVLREGDVIDGLTLNGQIENAMLNEDGDWAAIWSIDNGTDNLEALMLNGEILLLEGDLVDWNNDRLIDGSDQNGFISDFTSASVSGRGFTLSDRDANGDVRLLFPADVDLGGTVLEGGFRMSVSAVPEPSSMMVLLSLSGPILARRRRFV